MTNDLSTLICLFHHQDHAQTALEEVLEAGVPEANVTLIGAPGSTIAASRSTMTELNVPENDVQHLLDGIEGGGAVLAVSALSALSERVEAIFEKHRAAKIDEATIADDMSAQAVPLMASGTAAAEGFVAEDESGLLLSEPEQLAEDLVLVTGTVDAAGVAHIESIQPIEAVTSPALQEDVDPRELGLDARMSPVVGNPQVQ